MNLKIIIILSISHFFIDITGTAIPAIMPLIKEALRLNYTQIGLAVMISNITSSFIQPFFGYISDRIEIKWLLPLSVILTFGGFSVLGLVPSYGLLLVFIFINSIGVATYHPESFKIAHFFTGQHKATGMSFFQMGGSLGLALGPLLIMYAAKLAGLKGTLFFLILGIMILCILLLFYRQIIFPLKKENRTVERSIGFQTVEKKPAWFSMLLLIIAVSLRSWTHMGLITFSPFYYIKFLHGDPINAGKFVFAFLIGGALGTVMGGIVADKIGYKRFSYLSMIISTPLLFLFLQLSGIWSFLMIFMVGFVLISSFSVTVAMGQNILCNRLGLASGLMLGFNIGIGGVGAGLLGFVADMRGIMTVMTLISIMPAVGCVPLLLIPYSPGNSVEDEGRK